MIEVVKQGKKWIIVDHILNLNSEPYSKKADADFDAQELEAKYNAAEEEIPAETTTENQP